MKSAKPLEPQGKPAPFPTTEAELIVLLKEYWSRNYDLLVETETPKDRES